MGEIKNKASNAAKGVKGKVKAAAGKTTENRKLEAKGKADQAKATVKKTGQKLKGKLR
ncbi:MAG: CsbD family protein [Acidimicrobiales bacterium]